MTRTFSPEDFAAIAEILRTDQRFLDQLWPAPLTEVQLARRWRVSVKKLQADRLSGRGLPFFRVPGGRSVRYRFEDVLSAEKRGLVSSTSERPQTISPVAALSTEVKFEDA